MKILLVDDSRMYRSAMVELLEKLGHFVIESASAQQAILAFDTNADTELVITDLEMERALSGLTVLKHVRSASPTAKLCLMSGNLTDEVAYEFEQLGGRVFEKPFSPKQLIQMFSDFERPDKDTMEDFTALCDGCGKVTRPIKLAVEIKSRKMGLTQTSTHKCVGCNYDGILVDIVPHGEKKGTKRLMHPSSLY